MRYYWYSQEGTTSQGNPKENQDHTLCGSFPIDSHTTGYFLVVSDGLGSKAHSDVGSLSLCHATEKILSQNPHGLKESNQADFIGQVHKEWKKGLGSHPLHQCTCTALIAVVLKNSVFLFRLGDGVLAGVWKGQTHILMEDKGNDGKFLNETDGLSQDLILGQWDFRCYPREGLRGILAFTDGIEIGDQSLPSYDDFSRDFLKTLFPHQDSVPIQTELQKLVDTQSNHDDKTIALLLEDIAPWKQHLAKDMTVYDTCGNPHFCEEAISQGGQGIVYRTQEPNVAVKILFDAQGEKDCLQLDRNQMFQQIRCLPTPSQVTLPQVVLEDYVGYTMELLEDMDSFDTAFSLHTHPYEGDDWFLEQHKDQKDLVQLLHNYKRSGGLRRRLLAYYKLSTIFLKLHCRGLTFGDFSPKNVFLSRSLDFSHVWLIDVDNIDYEGNHQKKLGYYTPRFVAPEVAKKQRGCSAYSDDYSFALALFLQVTGTHPFATQEDTPQETALPAETFLEDFADNTALTQRDCGEFPWIMEKEGDTSLPYSFLISPRLHHLFTRTFSETGKLKRDSRASSLEWQDGLGRALDATITCPHCGFDYQYQGHLTCCPWCDSTVPLLKVDSYLEGSSSGETPPLWSFVQERTHVLSLPLRLLQGEEQEEDLLSVLGYVEEKGGELLLTKLHPRYQFEVRDSQGSWGGNHRNFAVKDTSFHLLCRGAHLNFRLEVTLL